MGPSLTTQRIIDALRHRVKGVGRQESRLFPNRWKMTRILVNALQQRVYQRRTALPQVNPDPKAVIETICPGLRRPSRSASASSIGIEAAEQFP